MSREKGQVMGQARRIVASVVAIGMAAVGLAVLAGSAGGQVTPRPEPNCEVPGSPTDRVAAQQVPRTCATLRVTKVVNGTAPAGTTFTVLVECTSTDPDIPRAEQLPPGQLPPFTTALTFPAGGGTQDVLIGGLSSCTVSEAPPPPACTLAGVTPPTTQITAPQVYPVFVTNNCATPVAAAAQQTVVVPVVGTPRFTG
jgi:hypothetical protein